MVKPPMPWPIAANAHPDHRYAAGSGKTRGRLPAGRESPCSPTEPVPRAIVAFTFTEKAAAELKEPDPASQGHGAPRRWGDRPARLQRVRGNDPRLLLPAPAVLRTAVRDVHAARRQPTRLNFLYREGGQHRLRPGSNGSIHWASKLVPGHRTVSSAASTWWRTSCSTLEPRFRRATSQGIDPRPQYYETLERLPSSCRSAFRSCGPSRPLEDPEVHAAGDGRSPAPNRRRVPGRQPRPGAPDLAARQAARHGRPCGGRRRRPGDLPVARLERGQHRHLHRSLRRRGPVQPPRQPAVASAGIRRPGELLRQVDSRSARQGRCSRTGRRTDTGPSVDLAAGFDDEQQEAEMLALDDQRVEPPRQRALPAPWPFSCVVARLRTPARSSTRSRAYGVPGAAGRPYGPVRAATSRRGARRDLRAWLSPASTGHRGALSRARQKRSSNWMTSSRLIPGPASTSTTRQVARALRAHLAGLEDPSAPSNGL